MTAKSLTHAFVSAIADGADATLVRPSNWNADHSFWLGYRTVTITTDTIANSDHLSLVTYNSSSAIAVSLPAPTGGNMPLGWRTTLRNIAAGAVTVSGTGGATINLGLSSVASFVLNQGDTLDLWSTGGSTYYGILSRITVSRIVTQVITASGTYIPTAGMLFAIMEVVGGGGGSGGTGSGTSTTAGNGGGGGSGSYSRSTRSAAQIGASQTVTIGSGGSAGSAGAGDGGAGGTTSIGTLCTANGGAGGTHYTTQGGLVPMAAGGAVGTGDFTIPGNPGGMPGGNSGPVALLLAHGANSMFGAGGLIPAVANNAVSAGSASPPVGYGSGARGGIAVGSTGTAAGGVGAPGVAVITEFCM